MSGRVASRKITRRNTRVPRNRKKPNYALLAWVGLISALVSGAMAFGINSPSFTIRDRPAVSGVKLADSSLVEAAANEVLGRNTILLRKSPIIRKIENLPEVKDATMGRGWPNRIWVRVEERRPAAVVVDSQSCCLVERDGFAFHRLSRLPKNLPVIRIDGFANAKPGWVVSSPGVRSALEVLKHARRCRIEACKISVDPNCDICLNMGSGFYVKLGQPDGIAAKMSCLRRTLEHRPSIVQDGMYIDLSCPSAPVWKPRAIAQVAL